MAESKQSSLFDGGNSYNANKFLGTYLFFDTETTGLPKKWQAPVTDLDNWPRLIQIAWVVYKNGIKIESKDLIIKPENFEIPLDASKIHGITTERAQKDGILLQEALNELNNLISQADYLVGHNISFDEMIVGAEFLRKNIQNSLSDKKKICTKEMSTDFCAIPSINGYGRYKWPKLSELHLKLFSMAFDDSHNARADVEATAKCFWEMKRLGI
ncbi:MAG: 3'-5' exonuclease [Candidatus Staskawiczbacteria bacterium]|nr:3'-5' exonuclease [Candidatus Staskawiczbacteria bacterium]